MKSNSPTCQVCNQGNLVRKKKYRLSGPVVVIGYLFLIPSVLGMLLCLLMLFISGGAAGETHAITQSQIRENLSAVNIPASYIDKVVEGQTLTDSEKSSLSNEQQKAIAAAHLDISASRLGSAGGAFIAGGLSLFGFVACFAGGFLGWLLTMKKKVLQCTSCQAILAAG